MPYCPIFVLFVLVANIPDLNVLTVVSPLAGWMLRGFTVDAFIFFFERGEVPYPDFSKALTWYPKNVSCFFSKVPVRKAL